MSAEVQNYWIELGDGSVITADAVCLSDGRYRIECVPLTTAFEFRDVIEVELVEPGKLRFVRIVERGGWTTKCYFLARGEHGAPHIEALLSRVEQIGGHAERIFGGVLCVCIPPGEDLDGESGSRQGTTP